MHVATCAGKYACSHLLHELYLFLNLQQVCKSLFNHGPAAAAAAVRQLDVREAGGGQRQLLQLARNGVKLEINSISSPW
jgi:hypothetical protein